ncbi:MAG: sigma-70 family RNA polymerase sigma factor [Gemmataceae bacterium]|nr:sigma-70 family RNA polymerase sigma factor [Gemmataceae bacterium]
MAAGPLSNVIRHLQRVAAHHPGEGPTDSELLERFAVARDEGAFELLVWRHGGMVLGVCRRVVRDSHAAEDAFQATFLALARQAAAIGKGQALAAWLYRVAYRIALRARAAAAQRAQHERQRPPPAPEAPTDSTERADLRAVLDEELARLAERYRAPVVLCYLEGKTTQEAARQLGCPRGTVLSRLAQARQRLRGRLARRGLAPAALLAAALCQRVALSAGLVDATTRAAALFVAGESAGAIPVQVAALTKGALSAMLLARLKVVVTILLAAVGLATGAVLLVQSWPGAVASEPAPAPRPAAIQPVAQPPSKPKTDSELILGSWELVERISGGLKAYKSRNVFVITKTYILLKRDAGFDNDAMTYRLDPTQKPRAIDLERPDRPEDPAFPGIYELTGDTLKICVPEDSRNLERPAELAVPPGSKRVLLVLRRLPKTEKVDEAKIKAQVERRIVQRQASRKLFRLGHALFQYQDEQGRFPPAAILSPAGKPLLSWRVAILPYLGEGDLYRQFKLEERWDSKHNKALLERMPDVFAPVNVQPKEPHVTFYRVFTGASTAFDGKEGVKLEDFTDNRATTVLVVEAGEPVPWTRPGDLPYDGGRLPKLGGLFGGSFHMLMADGSVRFVLPGFDEEIFRRAITRDDGKSISLDDLNRKR